MNVKQRLSTLITSLNLKRYQFAESINVAPGSISDWLNRSNCNPSIDALIRICHVHNVNLNWLLTGQGDMFISSNPSHPVLDTGSSHPSHPVLDTGSSHPSHPSLDGGSYLRIEIAAQIAAGTPLPAFENPDKQYICLPKYLLPANGHYLAFQISGHSMEPSIMDSDLAIINTAYHGLDMDNRIIAFRNCDGIMLKKLVLNHKSKSGFLVSLNSDYNPIPYSFTDTDLVIIGILIMTLRYYNLDLLHTNN